jgi:hypothetical protein
MLRRAVPADFRALSFMPGGCRKITPKYRLWRSFTTGVQAKNFFALRTGGSPRAIRDLGLIYVSRGEGGALLFGRNTAT